MIPLLQSLRPKQWIKNVLVFAALLFSLNADHSDLLLRSVWAFLLFCTASSSIYLINDTLDINQDRQHPVKSKRPIASGNVPLPAAWTAALFLFLGSVVLGYILAPTFALTLLIYVVLQLLYSTRLKHVVIVDVMIIAAGFVLRAIAGGVAINVLISHWLLTCTFLLALFLGFGKRRHELVLMEGGAANHRRVLDEYSPYFLDQMMGVVTASTVIVYILYTTSQDVVARFGTVNLIYTVPFALYGIFRYLYLVHKKDRGGDPTALLFDDRPLQLAIALWAVAVVLILYHSNITALFVH